MAKKAEGTKNVVIKFDKKLKPFKKPIDKDSLYQFMPYREEDTVEGRVKYTANFICKEINKQYHPFKILCKKFCDILAVYLQN